MFELLYTYFLNIFAHSNNSGLLYSVYAKLMLDTKYTIGGVEYSQLEYVASTLAIVSTIIIIVLCCLFVYKIVRLIGGLIR